MFLRKSFFKEKIFFLDKQNLLSKLKIYYFILIFNGILQNLVNTKIFV